MPPIGQQNDIALDLIRQGPCEAKLAVILFLQEIPLPAGTVNWRADLPRFGELFDEGRIYRLGPAGCSVI